MSAKRLKRGRDWHGWVWRAVGKEWRQRGEDGLFFWAEAERPKSRQPTDRGRWVRVRFVQLRP